MLVTEHAGNEEGPPFRRKANFWTPGPNRAGEITCTGQASVMVGTQPDDGRLVVAIADPTHKGKSIHLEIDRKVGAVVSKDPGIDIVQLTPTVKLRVHVKGRRGESFHVVLAAPQGAPDQ